MSDQHVAVSTDRTTLVISTNNGHRAEFRSARRHGFTDADVDKARHLLLNPHLIAGQVDRARKFRLRHGWAVYVHLNTGPPTWWTPRLRISRGEVMCGWLRVMVAVSVRKENSNAN